MVKFALSTTTTVIMLATGLCLLSLMVAPAECVCIAEPANNRSYVPIFIEDALGCKDWTAQLAANMLMQGNTEYVTFDHFGPTYNPMNGVRYTFEWNDTITGVMMPIVGDMDVVYNEIPTSSGPITSYEIFQMGRQNFTRCSKRAPYRDSSLGMHTVHPENVQWFTTNKGPLVPGTNAVGCDMMAGDYFLLTKGGDCAQMEVHLWSKDGKSDYDQNADMLALGLPVRWTMTAWLNGALLGLPVDVKVADVWFRQSGAIYYELLMYNPLFFQSADQSRKRSDKPLALSKAWVFGKLARHADSVKATFPQHASIIDEIAATQM